MSVLFSPNSWTRATEQSDCYAATIGTRKYSIAEYGNTKYYKNKLKKINFYFRGEKN